MSEVPSYARRFFTKVRRETIYFIKHKLLTGACVAITALSVRLALWHFHQITLTWAEVLTSLLVIIGSFAAVVLGALLVNLFRAPALLDQEMKDEVAGLTERLKLVEPLREQREVNLRLAALMREEPEIRERLIRAPDPAEFLKVVAESEKWIGRAVALLKEAGFPTDAEAFSQVRNRAPVQKQVDEFRHVDEWKQHTIVVLAMHRRELDEIRSNRRL